jgi:hypothetical protein
MSIENNDIEVDCRVGGDIERSCPPLTWNLSSNDVSLGSSSSTSSISEENDEGNDISSLLNACERQPVPSRSYKGWFGFLSLFTLRHTAGTEFAIGPLFVARGATTVSSVV